MQEFLNVEDDYDGPYVVLTPSCCPHATTATLMSGNSALPPVPINSSSSISSNAADIVTGAVRVVRANEEELTQSLFAASDLGASK